MINEIKKLKKEKNAIILAHNYQPKEIQEIADFRGDSLELCIKASEITDKDLIIFCGVDFMAETAYILNQDKKIIIPDLEADCEMANMLSENELLKYIDKYPEAAVCLYVNSKAEVKQHATTLCTSANALEIVEKLEEDTVLFGPDNNLANYVSEKTNKKIIPVPKGGHCYVHNNLNNEDIENKRKEYPGIEIICHPECPIEIQHTCDKVLSTGGMLKYIKNSDKKEFILATEVDMISRLEIELPEKTIYPLNEKAVCKKMKYHNLEKIKEALLNESPQIILNDEIASKSLKAVKNMLN